MIPRAWCAQLHLRSADPKRQCSMWGASSAYLKESSAKRETLRWSTGMEAHSVATSVTWTDRVSLDLGLSPRAVYRPPGVNDHPLPAFGTLRIIR